MLRTSSHLGWAAAKARGSARASGLLHSRLMARLDFLGTTLETADRMVEAMEEYICLPPKMAELEPLLQAMSKEAGGLLNLKPVRNRALHTLALLLRCRCENGLLRWAWAYRAWR